MNHPSWYKYAVKAGLVAGIIFIVIEMLLVPLLLDGSPWGPPRLIAALVLNPTQVLPPPADFEFGVVGTAVVIHLALSVVYTIPFSFVAVKMRSLTGLILIGAFYGLLLYVINFYLFTYAFPWFEEARNWVTILAHISFGVILAVFPKPLEEDADKEND
ncbi:MAG: hypothetical protein ACNS60_18745 [Candidatus Cyclobacteriaceae bacterium M2_1C_046]